LKNSGAPLFFYAIITKKGVACEKMLYNDGMLTFF